MIPELSPRSILVIQVTRIGDTLLTTPALRAIAARWPQAKITFLGHPKRVDVLRNLPYLAEIGTITKNTAPFHNRFTRQRWDLAVVFGFDKALVVYAKRVATQVACWQFSDSNVNDIADIAVPRPALGSCPAAALELALPVQAFAAPLQTLQLDYRVSESEQRWAEQQLKPLRVHANPLIGLVIESFPTKPYRDWPVEHYLAFCAQLERVYPQVGFVLLGSAIDKSKLRKLNAALGTRLRSFAGQLPLRQSAALIANLDLYVGVDTGPTHIAGAINRLPMIGLYHALHRSQIYGPWGRTNAILIDHPAVETTRVNIEAAGVNSSEHAHMADIAPESVLSAALVLLGESLSTEFARESRSITL